MLLLGLLCQVAAFAVVAYPYPFTVTQPDGSQLTLLGHGDEFCHFLTTTDGYTVVKGSDGCYYYAHLDGSVLAATTVRANNMELRNPAEQRFLRSVSRYLFPPLSPAMQQKQIRFNKMTHPGANTPLRWIQRSGSARSYRGLVILVDFSDCHFLHDNTSVHDLYANMMNQCNFTGFDDPVHGWQTCTGSVRDYFFDNSYGTFDPQFDVVGPVTIDASQYDINGVDSTVSLTAKVLDAVDDSVDFSRYDCNGDGEVDMVYIIYAGFSSNYQGNDSRLVWPHAFSLVDPDDDSQNFYHDGVRMGRYACSAERYGWASDDSTIVDGIGVIVHEFSHVLGFEDHYNTYPNGSQEDPNSWDVMATGNYLGTYNRTPCGYNSYEKHSAGFISLQDISNMDDEQITLRPFGDYQDACLIRSVQPHVSFMMENRQQQRWDEFLPGHGMLVWRVDSVVPEYWTHNLVNVDKRACFRLVRADGTQGSPIVGVIDTDFDPFPGTHRITELTNEPARANLFSYDRYAAPVVLKSIAEDDGIIHLNVDKDPLTDDRPVNYDILDTLTAHAEQWVDGQWMPVSWTVVKGKITDSGQEREVLYSFLPNTIGMPVGQGQVNAHGPYVILSYGIDNRYVNVQAQRMTVNADSSVWICNLTDVDQGGAGAFSMTQTRHGIPVLDDPNMILGYCSEKASAFMVTQSGIRNRLALYRHLVFTEGKGPADGISVLHTSFRHRGTAYLLTGQRAQLQRPGLYIIDGKKVIVR